MPPDAYSISNEDTDISVCFVQIVGLTGPTLRLPGCGIHYRPHLLKPIPVTNSSGDIGYFRSIADSLISNIIFGRGTSIRSIAT